MATSGDAAALAFSNPDAWRGRAVDLPGDDPTMQETADAFSRVLGRTVEYGQVPWDAFEEQGGEEMTTMCRWFEAEGYEADIEALRSEHPDLERLEPFLRRQDWIRSAAGEPS